MNTVIQPRGDNDVMRHICSNTTWTNDCRVDRAVLLVLKVCFDVTSTGQVHVSHASTGKKILAEQYELAVQTVRLVVQYRE